MHSLQRQYVFLQNSQINFCCSPILELLLSITFPYLCFQDCINRIQDLQNDGKLTGVIDDRGKFIYITPEELDSIVKFIKQHGRVSIQELAESSNRLINLNPDNADIRKKLLVGDSEPDLIEVTE